MRAATKTLAAASRAHTSSAPSRSATVRARTGLWVRSTPPACLPPGPVSTASPDLYARDLRRDHGRGRAEGRANPAGGRQTMRLDHLFDANWHYDLLHEVGSTDGGDGQVYGQGTGILSGRVNGTARWANYPRLRGGYAFPEAGAPWTWATAASCCSASPGCPPSR